MSPLAWVLVTSLWTVGAVLNAITFFSKRSPEERFGGGDVRFTLANGCLLVALLIVILSLP